MIGMLKLRILFFVYLPCFALSAFALGQVPAPRQREYPPNDYYQSLELIDRGDYVRAAQAIRSAARGGIRTSEGAWVDSICYHAMIGECLYNMGDLTLALEQFTNAVQLLTVHANWLLRVDFPATIETSNLTSRNPVNWAVTARRSTPGRFASRYPILQGRFDNQQVIRQGGVVALPEFYLINATEIVRCAALAIRRRAEIMGRACPHDPLTERLVAILGTRPAPPNHWSSAWIDGLLGLAYVSAGRAPEAVSELTKAIQLPGQIDHPLTPTMLFQLGRLAFQQGQTDTASKMFLEASLSAASWDQTDLIEESFRWLTLTHLVTGVNGMLPALEPALAWARRERSQLLEASLLIQSGQVAAELNEPAVAAEFVDQARRALTRSEMLRGAMGARHNYVAALVAFQAGNLAAGETAWSAVVAYQTNTRSTASLRLFEIGLVDAMAISGQITPRIASELYADVLREPSVTDWTTNLVETMTVTLAPNLAAFEHWLEIARERGEHERVIEITDRIRRLRFFSTLPMGGRLLALTWVMEATKEALPEAAVLTRQDLFTRYPAFAEASRRVTQIRADLAKLPLVTTEASELKQQQKLWSELAGISRTQEVMLRAIALRREPASFVFPPPLDFKKIQERLQPGQAILAFFMTSQNQLYGAVIRKADYAQWQIAGANKFGKDLTDLLKKLGQLDRTTPVTSDVLVATEWKQVGTDLWTKLTSGAKAKDWQGVDELIIVPDRWLWHVPFEALSPDASDAPPLISRFSVRYAPTVALALPDARPAFTGKDTATFIGRGLTKDESVLAIAAVADLRKNLTSVTELTSPPVAPSQLLASQPRRLVVFDDLETMNRGPYEWLPLPIDKDKTIGMLTHWMALPWGAPEQLILPGFHTAAENTIKRTGTGDEVFLAACGMLASGSRTILLSRWRTGGQISYDLTREFTQELPFSPAAVAWQRSVQLVKDRELDLAREPRVKATEAAKELEKPLTAAHPFFWAGYLLIGG